MLVSMLQQTHAGSRQAGRSAGVVLWIVQGLLAALFLFAGGAKLVLPIELMTAQLPLPGAFLRFAGVCEVLGALGLLLPGLTHIRPGLTILAAAELVHMMIGATVLTLITADVTSALVPLVVGFLAAFVAYGRWRLAPQHSGRLTLPRKAWHPATHPTLHPVAFQPASSPDRTLHKRRRAVW